MNSNTVKAGAAGLIFLVAIVLLVSRGGGGPAREDAYFYDLESDELFAGSALEFPPIAAPGGAGQGVTAVVMTCGACTDAELKIAYLRTLTDEAHRLAATQGLGSPEVLQAGIMVAPPPAKGAEPAWVRMDSAAGEAVVSADQRLCGDAPAVVCTPDGH